MQSSPADPAAGTAMLERLAAGAVILVHLAFILFVAFGGVLVLSALL